MDIFSEDFKTKLYDTIEQIENENSEVEIVSIIRNQSEKYFDVSLLLSVGLMFILYAVLMIIPVEINVYLIFFVIVLSFFVFAAVFLFFPQLIRPFVKKERMKRNVEIMARAIFQKGEIYLTQNNIGVLFFVSLFEKEVFILPDKGAENSIPPEELDIMKQDFNQIFNSSDIAQSFLDKLSSTKEIFAKYIPPVENDINEIPDNLKIEL